MTLLLLQDIAHFC